MTPAQEKLIREQEAELIQGLQRVCADFMAQCEIVGISAVVYQTTVTFHLTQGLAMMLLTTNATDLEATKKLLGEMMLSLLDQRRQERPEVLH
jgi:hypothetical protein